VKRGKRLISRLISLRTSAAVASDFRYDLPQVGAPIRAPGTPPTPLRGADATLQHFLHLCIRLRGLFPYLNSLTSSLFSSFNHLNARKHNVTNLHPIYISSVRPVYYLNPILPHASLTNLHPFTGYRALVDHGRVTLPMCLCRLIRMQGKMGVRIPPTAFVTWCHFFGFAYNKSTRTSSRFPSLGSFRIFQADSNSESNRITISPCPISGT
jgi:hypothetical protein